MRAPWLTALAALALCTGVAYGQAYQYVAQTAAPVARSGAVTAGTLTWQCSGSECRISGPWPAPGVSACAALAGQVGRIASYGRAGAMLNTAQLTQCNANVPVTTLQVDPNVLRQHPGPANLPPIRNGGASPATPAMTVEPAAPPTQVVVQTAPRPEDIRVFALSGSTISFHGRTPALPAPALPAPTARINRGVLVVPALTLQASAPGVEPTARSTRESPPFYRNGPTGDVVLRIPVLMTDLPSDMLGLYLQCDLLRGRYVPAPVNTSPYRALWSPGSGAEEADIATGDADVYIASHINRWETTIDVPLHLLPLARLEDARSYVCTIRAGVDRGDRTGRDLIMLPDLVMPTSSTSRAPYHPAAGTTPQLYIRGNIQ